MKIWNRIKNFFRSIGKAFKELFSKTPVEEVNEDGETTVRAEVIRPKEPSEFAKWCKKIGSNIGNYFKDLIEEISENPAKGVIKVTAMSASLGIIMSFFEKFANIFRPKQRPQYNPYADPRMYQGVA